MDGAVEEALAALFAMELGMYSQGSADGRHPTEVDVQIGSPRNRSPRISQLTEHPVEEQRDGAAVNGAVTSDIEVRESTVAYSSSRSTVTSSSGGWSARVCSARRTPSQLGPSSLRMRYDSRRSATRSNSAVASPDYVIRCLDADNDVVHAAHRGDQPGELAAGAAL